MERSRPSKKVYVAGAGLAGSLLGLFLRQRQPEIEVHIFEAGPRVPPNKTWSFHASDLPDSIRDPDRSDPQSITRRLPWISRAWPRSETRFPSLRKVHDTPYLTVFPEDLWSSLESSGAHLHFNAPVEELTPESVVCGGKLWQVDAVFDARGPSPFETPVGFQKFVGHRLRLKTPHGMQHPILMDATVPQKEGYRFFYLLPFSETEVLIEDTRYCESPEIGLDDFREEIGSYCRQQGFEVSSIVSEESGALPIPLYPPPLPLSETPRIGTAGHLFHTVTGYSAPDALRIADIVSSLPQVDSASVSSVLANYRKERKNRVHFYAGLNRMLFLAAEPRERVKIFEHFYRLPEPTIERFYSGSTSYADMVRILSGRPPVPLGKAFAALRRNQFTEDAGTK